jgi:uncharacterized membrane protein YfcA
MDGVTLPQMLLSVLSGVIVGFSLGLIGGGGSILAVPLLIYLVGYGDAHGAIGTTALAVSVNALLNVVPHAVKKHVDFKLGVVFSVFGLIGVYAGSEFGLATEGRKLLFLFSLLMIVIAVEMLRRKEEKPSSMVRPGGSSFSKLALASLGVGFLSGFFGIGGGFLIVPALVSFSTLDIAQAIGTSQIAVFSFGLLTALRYFLEGYLNATIACLYIAGGVFGGWMGAFFMSRMPRATLTKLYAGVLILVAFYMMFMNIGALTT